MYGHERGPDGVQRGRSQGGASCCQGRASWSTASPAGHATWQAPRPTSLEVPLLQVADVAHGGGQRAQRLNADGDVDEVWVVRRHAAGSGMGLGLGMG